MANPRYNSQVTQPRGNQTRVGKMGGGMMMQRPMYNKGGPISFIKKKLKDRKRKKKEEKAVRTLKEDMAVQKLQEQVRDSKKAGGRIAGAARRAQQHGYYTPDMGMKGGKMYAKGGKVSGKKKIIAGGVGKIKNYPGIKKLIEMNKKGKKKFRDGGSAKMSPSERKNTKDRTPSQMRQGLKPVGASQKGLKKLPTKVRNKMGFMKDGGMTRNTRRMNRLEELGRVDAEKGRTRKGKRNLRDEKKRIVRELKR